MCEGMFLDKHGACSVLSAFKAVVEADLKVNLVCTVGMVENMTGSNAYHPSDII
jgi:leucyl aminopeptidase